MMMFRIVEPILIFMNNESPRSGRQRKAWGVSPRIASTKAIKARRAGGRAQTHLLALADDG
jgi:hypothetical protein